MPDSDEKAVVFLLPDGTEVSNDPRYYNEKLREQILATYDNPGHATPTMQELHESLGTGDPLSVTTGRQAGGLKVAPPPPPAPDAPQDLREQLGGAPSDDDVDPDAPDEDTKVEDMTVKELKAEVRRLRDEGVEVDTAGVTKRSELVKAVQKAEKSREIKA